MRRIRKVAREDSGLARLYRDQGYTYAFIGRALGVTRQTAYYWARARDRRFGSRKGA